jgi:photosystem I P700 chlorophyll a apoprotein A1
VFLGLFWMYNSISVVIFHFSWKMQSDVSDGNFSRSANTVNGWLRDFLWSQSSQVIQSCGPSLSAYGLMFLAGHFVWSFSLMFLFSGRGYWQELLHTSAGTEHYTRPSGGSSSLLAGRNRDNLGIL